MTYARRLIDQELDELFGDIGALAIDGPKGVGKTTTARQRAQSIVNLDSKVTREIIAAEPERTLQEPRPLLVDEWQKVPEVWDVVRRSIDADNRGGQFLLVGSASPAPGATAHSGAGRIAHLRMRPMTLQERGVCEPTVSLSALLSGGRPPLSGKSDLRLTSYVEEIIRSGFPGLRDLGARARKVQLDSYVRNAVDRDIADQGLTFRNPDAMLGWLRAYAAATSTTASYSEILNAATPGESDKPARSTTDAFRNALQTLWLLDPLPPWLPMGSQLNRLGRSPKHHLADPALAAQLLGVTSESLLNGEGSVLPGQAGTLLGHLFESLVTLSVRVLAQCLEAEVGHMRTQGGAHEVDVLVIRPDGRVVAMEVKLAADVSVKDTKHLAWLADNIGDRLLDAIVITTGPEAYRRKDGIGVVPLALLGI